LDKKLYPHCIKRVFGCTLSPEQELRLSEIFDPNLSDIGKMCLTKDISFGLDFTLSEGVHKEKQEEVLAAFTRFYKEVVVQSVQASTLKNPLLANPDIVNRYLEQFLVPFKEGSSMHKCLEIVFDKRHDSAKKVLGSLGRASGARDTSARLALSFKLEAKKRKKQHDQWTETLNNFRKFASGKSDRELLDPSIAPKDPDLIMAELIAAFADETPSKSKKKKKATTKTESKAQEAPATKAPKKSQPPKTNKQPLEDALISLQRNATNWNHLDSRVGKWGDLSPNAIRAITNCKGDELYAHYTDKEAFETQARHYLRGIQAIILDEQLLNTFTFPTTYHDEGTELQGRGLFAKLHFQGTTEFGIVYLGIDRSQVVYHAFFETELNGKRQSDELLHPRILTHLFQDSIQEKIDPSTWDYVSRTSFSSTEDGSSLQLIQSDHAGQMELCYEFFALR
ncbi:MAG: hypothetical protein KAR79_01975, partial [Simkaniaceae bacterium]|nr:hypothetical protein [Simkaniaceae bacterium]